MQIGLTSKTQKLLTPISRVSDLPPTPPHTKIQILQWVERQERFKTSSRDFSVERRKRRSESDPEKEMGLKRYFPSPENAHSGKRPETF
jgi:hypothetical protein